MDDNNKKQSNAKVISYLKANKKSNTNRNDSSSLLKDDSILSNKSVNSIDLNSKDKDNFELTPLNEGIKSPRISAEAIKSKFKVEIPNIKLDSISPPTIRYESKNNNNKNNISSTSVISLNNNSNSDININRQNNSSSEINSVLSMFKNTNLLSSNVNSNNKFTNNASGISKITNINTSSKTANSNINNNSLEESPNSLLINKQTMAANKNEINIAKNNNKINSENSKTSEVLNNKLDLNNPLKFSNIFASNLISGGDINNICKNINDEKNNTYTNKKSSSKLIVSVSKIMDGLNSPVKNKNIPNNNKVHSGFGFEDLNNPNAVSVKEYAYSEDKNTQYRNNMEDFSKIVDSYMNDNTKGFFSLYDGHGGNDTVLYVKEKMPDILSKCLLNKDSVEDALNTAFQKIDDQLQYCDSEKTGATGIVVYKVKDYIYCANVGDSKCYLVNKKIATELTFDHKCSDENEVERIKKCGGIVFGGRVFGQLALTRAFGDYELKKYGVVAVPHITKIKIEQDMGFLVMASDGVWDVTNGDDLYKTIHDNINLSTNELAKLIVKNAILNGTRDNVSCIVIKIN